MKASFLWVVVILGSFSANANPTRDQKLEAVAMTDCNCDVSSGKPIDLKRAGLTPDVLKAVQASAPAEKNEKKEKKDLEREMKQREKLLARIEKMKCPKADKEGEIDSSEMMEKITNRYSELMGDKRFQSEVEEAVDERLEYCVANPNEEQEKKIKKAMQQEMQLAQLNAMTMGNLQGPTSMTGNTNNFSMPNSGAFSMTGMNSGNFNLSSFNTSPLSSYYSGSTFGQSSWQTANPYLLNYSMLQQKQPTNYLSSPLLGY